MFSGIVDGQGVLMKTQARGAGFRIAVRHKGLKGLGKRVRVGDSVAINGCCLTALSNRNHIFQFDVLKETWGRTSFRHIHPPEKVNLETSLRVGDPIGGHFVTGHIDGVGRIIRYERRNTDVLMKIEPPSYFMDWITVKGSVAIDGVSLTVAQKGRSYFKVWLIPHTLKRTTLGWKRKGAWVNLEGDMLAKYIQKGSRMP